MARTGPSAPYRATLPAMPNHGRWDMTPRMDVPAALAMRVAAFGVGPPLPFHNGTTLGGNQVGRPVGQGLSGRPAGRVTL
jgi:hypothetical protein